MAVLAAGVSAMAEVDNIPDAGPAVAEAADWFARLQDEGATGDDWRRFEDWLAASPAHGKAYEALEALWVELDASRDAIAERLDALAPSGGRSPSPRRAPRPVRAITRRRLWAGAGAIAATVLAAVVGLNLTSSPTPMVSYRTANGETREVTLADGTRVQLNAGSQIAVGLSAHERRVLLVDAEASFDVAHDPSRPFLIRVGDREVRVVGTEFNVRRRDNKLALTVRRGVVEVLDPAMGAARAVRLVKGQQLIHQDGDATYVIRDVEPDAAFAWRSGRLIYLDQPLGDIATDLSRRFATPIRVADARTARIPFSGVLVLDDEAAVTRRLEAFLPVTADHRPGEIVLRPKR
jgi:transmembrane sensor